MTKGDLTIPVFSHPRRPKGSYWGRESLNGRDKNLGEEKSRTRIRAPGDKVLKCHYDENCIFSIKAVLKHKQVACMRRTMPFTIF